VVSELTVVLRVTIKPKTNLLIFPPNSEPARASGPGRSDSRVVAGSSALQKGMFFINVAEPLAGASTPLNFTADINQTSWSGGSEGQRDWLQVELNSTLLSFIGDTTSIFLNYTFVPTEVRRRTEEEY
jgi:hypothetical protein